MAASDLEGPSEGASGGESPARAALSLVLDGGNSALGGPVEGIGGDGLVKEGHVEVAVTVEGRVFRRGICPGECFLCPAWVSTRPPRRRGGPGAAALANVPCRVDPGPCREGDIAGAMSWRRGYAFWGHGEPQTEEPRVVRGGRG